MIAFIVLVSVAASVAISPTTPPVLPAASVLASATAPDDDGAALTVTVDGCPGLVAADVERLVRLELASVTQEIREGPPLQVGLTCDDAELRIAVSDPLTGKQLERNVPRPNPAPGQERVVALAVSQLFAASWLELLLAAPTESPADESSPPLAVPGTTEEAVQAATKLAGRALEPGDEVTPREQSEPSDVELLGAAGVRGRSLQSAPFPTLHLDLELRRWFGRAAGLAFRTDFDFGRALRRAGHVRAWDIVASGGLVWRASQRRVSVGGAALVGLGWVQLRGAGARDEVAARGQQGVSGQGLLSLGPRIRSSRLRIDVDAEVGGMLRTPRGLISGEPAVSMGGIFAGASLRVGGAFRRRSDGS